MRKKSGSALTPVLLSNQRFDGALFLSLPVRNERGESRREGPSRAITPPLPGPLLPPASGREGEEARRPGTASGAPHSEAARTGHASACRIGVRRSGSWAGRSAFTLIEMLVVIAIIGILAALIVG